MNIRLSDDMMREISDLYLGFTSRGGDFGLVSEDQLERLSLLLISPPLGSGRVIEHHRHHQAQFVELLGHGHVDVVERVPVRLEGPLPDSEEDDVADHEGDEDDEEEDQEAVDLLVVARSMRSE